MVEQRFSSPFYGTLLISSIIIHWKFMVALFFLSEEKIWESKGLLKTEYLQNLLLDPTHPIISVCLWALPFLLTFLVIWTFPELFLIKAHRKNEEYESKKTIISILEKRKIEEEKTALEEQRAKKIEVVAKTTKQEKQIKKSNPMVAWLDELKKFSYNPENIEALKKANQIIYQYGGKYSTSPSHPYDEYLNPNYFSKLDVIGLIRKDKVGGQLTIDFSEKGKFFVMELQNKGVL